MSIDERLLNDVADGSIAYDDPVVYATRSGWLTAHGYNRQPGSQIPLDGSGSDAAGSDSKSQTRVPVTRSGVLRAAEGLINGDRAEQYGDAADTHQRIMLAYCVIVGDEPEPTPVNAAIFHIVTKLVRAAKTPTKADSWIDIAGYAALAAEMAGAE